MLGLGDDLPLRGRGRRLVPFTLSEISRKALIGTIPLGVIYALLLAGPIVAAWWRGVQIEPVFQVTYLALAAELLAFVPLAVVALKRNAEKDLPREVRLARMSGVARGILIALAVFMGSCLAAFLATHQVIILPGTGALLVFAITWQDLRSWRRFREYLARHEQDQAPADGQSQEPGQPQGLWERKPDPGQ